MPDGTGDGIEFSDSIGRDPDSQPQVRRKIVPSTRGVPLEGALGENPLARFWYMLDSVVSQTDYTQPLGRQTVILDLACGRCDEGIMLNRYFGGGYIQTESDDVRLVGVDVSEGQISNAIANYQRANIAGVEPANNLLPNYEFYPGDATDLSEIPQVPKGADVVVVRRQHTEEDPTMWAKIFQQGLSRLTDDGIMLVTSFSEREHTMAIDVIRDVGGNVFKSMANPFAKPFQGDLSTPGDEGYVAAVKKVSQAKKV